MAGDLRRYQNPVTGLFAMRLRHLTRFLDTTVESRIGTFANHTYGSYALSLHAARTGDVAAAEAARRCVEAVCAGQGERGQWWWMVDTKTGRWVDRYPVYAVHQHAMGPFCFWAARDLTKVNLAEHFRRGLDWLFGENELGESLVQEELGLVWRAIQRADSNSDGDYGVPLNTLRRRRMVGLGLGPLQYRYPMTERLVLLREARAYAFGWMPLRARRCKRPRRASRRPRRRGGEAGMDARAALSRSLIAPLVMAKNGSRELTYLRRYRHTQFFSPEQLAAMQLRRLRETLANTLAHSPYYARTLRAAGLESAEDVRTLEDLARLPRLAKNTLREAWDEIVTPDPGGAPRQEKRTSGSTGVPLRILVDEAARQHKAALTARHNGWAGYRLGDPVGYVWGDVGAPKTAKERFRTWPGWSASRYWIPRKWMRRGWRPSRRRFARSGCAC